MNSTTLLLLYAASVVGAFIGWYACGPIQATSVRCVARASLIAFLCAPGVLVGHGIGVAPTLFALTVQPPFTLISIAITWLIALGLIFGIPALRTHQNRWPPSVQEFFIDGYLFKFLLFGLIHAMLMVTVLCFRAVTSKNANPYLVPVLFAAPVFFGTAPTVSLLWLGGGAVGSLAACGRQRSDCCALRRTGDCLLVGTQSQERLMGTTF